MVPAQRLRIYCATQKAHAALLNEKSDQLLLLSQHNSVHVFSPSETRGRTETADHAEIDDEGPEGDGLIISQVFQNLDTRSLGHTLIHIPRTKSTQDVLNTTLPWCEEGWVALSGNQTGGRGRRGADWTSPAGSVSFSIALRVDVQHSERLTFMQYIGAMAAVDAVEMPGWDGIKLQVKWPNDIYLDGLKVGGVLCEGALRGSVFHVVLGVGVNVTNEAPTTCLVRGGEAEVRERFVTHYLTAFEKLYDRFTEQGFDGRLMEKYLSAWMHSNQVIRLGSADGPRAVVKGLAPNGWVRVLREDLQAFQDLPPEDTSLDVSQGVMKKKKVCFDRGKT